MKLFTYYVIINTCQAPLQIIGLHLLWLLSMSCFSSIRENVTKIFYFILFLSRRVVVFIKIKIS